MNETIEQVAGTGSKSGLTELDEAKVNLTEREYRSIELWMIVREIEGLLAQYIQFTHPGTATLLAFWIVNTYLYEAFEYCGYAHLRSKHPGSGKTTLLEVMAKLSFGSPPVQTAPTAPNIYRSQSKIFFFDEIEQLNGLSNGDGAFIMAVLNAGFKKGAIITRQIKLKGADMESRQFGCYGPKALAGLASLDNEALESRCFFIPMPQATGRLKRLRHNTFERSALPIRTRLTKWAKVTKPWLEQMSDTLDTGFDELKQFSFRFQDIAEPLYLLSNFADESELLPLTPSLLDALTHGFQMKVMEDDLMRREVAFNDLVRA